MRLAEHAPRTNAFESGAETGGGELHFCLLRDAVARFAAQTAGNLLIVSDRTAYAALAFAARLPRSVSVVLDSADALPLFTVPDTVGAVFAAGGEETLTAARFFAEVRRVPCAVAPSDGACYGVFNDMGSVFVDGAPSMAALKAADVYCDVNLMEPTLLSARARLLLAKLARFEARALSAFGMQKKQLAAVHVEEPTKEAVVHANAVLRRSEEAGAWQGEGAVLARLYAPADAYRAFRELSALYAALFLRGKPQKYAVPDYSARAVRAGVPLSSVRIPTAEEYARRALVLERRRAEFAREIELIAREKIPETDSVYAFSKKTGTDEAKKRELGILPERCPDGLSAVIRDFGLMENL